MQILQSIENVELRPEIQVKSRVTNGGEIEENDVPVSLL